MSEPLCFDMYGTLCDTSSVVDRLGEELDAPTPLVRAVDELWRRKQLQYSYQLGQMGTYRPFWDLTAEALDYALTFHKLDPPAGARDRILGAYDSLEPFPDVLPVLDELRERSTPMAVLSNGNPEMLERLARNTGLDEYLGAVISAEEVRTFKPAPEVYENAARRLDRELHTCWLVSSNAWDVAGASQAGMNTAWINRNREPSERIGGSARLRLSSMSELPDALA